MLKLATVVGARPQFIKAAAISHAIAAHDDAIVEVMVHTGQHYDPAMNEVFFTELGIPQPAVNLDVRSGSHAQQTGAMLIGLEKAFEKLAPNAVLVYGDTNSTLAAAVVAAKMRLPLAHVEAGLRSGNRRMPEEINRIAADRLSDLLFTGTTTAKENLIAEGLGERVREVGDVMLDCVRLFGEQGRPVAGILARAGLPDGLYVLATIHRAENTDNPETLAGIFAGLGSIARHLPVVLPLHPRTSAAVKAGGGSNAFDGLHVIEPLPFLDMIALEANARLIVTDSGGVQKEAYFHGVPCVTVRGETEWVETVQSGWNCLSPAGGDALLADATRMLDLDRSRARPPFYGDGHAADRIVTHLRDWPHA